MQIPSIAIVVALLCSNVLAFPRGNGSPTGRMSSQPATTSLSNSTQVSTQPKSTSPSNNGNGGNSSSSKSIDPSLVPVFSIKAGSGVGANGVAIPENCPPARDDFIAKLSNNVAAGNVLGTPITFNNNSTAQDTNTNKQRATAMIITLQSFTGVKGVGCPGASTPELISQQKTGVFSA